LRRPPEKPSLVRNWGRAKVIIIVALKHLSIDVSQGQRVVQVIQMVVSR